MAYFNYCNCPVIVQYRYGMQPRTSNNVVLHWYCIRDIICICRTRYVSGISACKSQSILSLSLANLAATIFGIECEHYLFLWSFIWMRYLFCNFDHIRNWQQFQITGYRSQNSHWIIVNYYRIHLQCKFPSLLISSHRHRPCHRLQWLRAVTDGAEGSPAPRDARIRQLQANQRRGSMGPESYFIPTLTLRRRKIGALWFRNLIGFWFGGRKNSQLKSKPVEGRLINSKHKNVRKHNACCCALNSKYTWFRC